ncbi:MAG TPA: SagB family peptide dehydrogenase, partial [Candidatus Acidoferrum sp.]|nr:SagB family peptide dehydrogenase [Candidatus Acidoferrum sp.]
MPKPVKRYVRAPQMRLPPPRTHGEFARALLGRHTWRRFSRQPLSLSDLGTLLGLTWGVREWVSVPGVGRLALKTSPSGGALHPIEAYVLARRVKELAPGLYHYNSERHHLELLRRGATSRQVTGYLAGQWWFSNAAALILMTAVFPRTQWKYHSPGAYRVVLTEAGHLCQTFC